MRLPLSGAPWLSSLPSSWQVKPIAALFTERNQRNDGIGPKQLLSLSYGRVVRKDIDANDGLRPESYDTYQQLEPDNIVLRLIDLQNDKRSIRVGQATEKGIITSAYVALDTDAWACPRYAFYLLLVLDQLKVFYGLGSGMRQSITFSDLGRVPVGMPSEQEQYAIATYLDAETKRIDGLIEEKQTLLALLEEQKRMVAESVIAPAPGGREAKLGYFVDLLPGFAFPSEGFSQNNADRPLLRGVNVAPGAVRWEDVVYWPSDRTSGLERFFLDAGDVVFGMDRPWISSGTRVAMIDQASAGALLLQRVCRIRGDETMFNRFVYYALCSDKFRQSIEFELSGISVPHISPEQITRFRVPLLSIQEQAERCAAADAELAEVDRLIALTNDMVLRLQELRSATITDAVLGRIDVRDHMTA